LRLGRRELRDAQPNFAGGLNVAADRSALRPNELWRAEEIRLNEIGAATKRGGTQRIHAAALASGAPVRAGFSWLRAGVATEIVVCGGNVYKFVYGIPIVPTLIGAGINSTKQPSIVNFPNSSGVDTVFIADGGLLNSTDGTTLTPDIAGTPPCSVIFAYNRRLWGVGDPSNPDILYNSALDKGDTLGNVGAGGGASLIRTAGARDLMLGCALNAALALFHRSSLSRWTGFTQDDVAVQSGVQGFSPDTGSTAPHSLVMNEKIGVFLSDRGFYEISDEGIRAISAKIEPIVVSANHTTFDLVCGAHSRATRELLWYFPDVGIYCYNYRLINPDTGVGAWSGPWKGVFTSKGVYSMWSTMDAAGLPIVLVGGGDGFIRRMDAEGVVKDDVLSDGTGGSIITMAGTCARMFFKSPTHEKSFRRVWVTANLRGSGLFTVTLQCDTGSTSWTFPAATGGVWGVGTWGAPAKWGSVGTRTRKAELGGRGPYADLAFSDSGASSPAVSRIEVQGFDLNER
jgi:hypothetical protein